MKRCAGCSSEKPLDAFPRNKASKDGLYRLCKACNAAKLKARNTSPEFKAARAAYLAKNRKKINAQVMALYRKDVEVMRAKARERRASDPEAWNRATREWRARNPEKVKAVREAWFAARPGYVNERGMRRYASKKNATPKWADVATIREVYELAKEFREHGIDVNVDHIVPLRGRNVSGLHVPANLRIILADVNRKKSNAHVG